MNIEQVGSFRTRPTGDGSLEVWARGWRLESPLYALVPAGLALLFVLAPMPIPMRVVGAVLMLATTLFVFRLQNPGILLDGDGVTIVGVVRTRRFGWEAVGGFMGERKHDEGRILLVLEDGNRIPLPGTLDPGELDPYGEEGEMLSAVDQLNRLGERSRSGDLPRAAAAPAPSRVGSGDGSREERRSERKELKKALKAVRAREHGKEQRADVPKQEPDRRRRLLRRKAEPIEELTPVAISEPPSPGPRRAPQPQEAPGLPSYYPQPTYIPQAEYAQMLRDQKAAEKAAAAAAQELRELADLEELAEKDELSEWNP